MSYAPKKLTELGAYWTAHGGVNLGIVGDTHHTAGYHLGRDRIYSSTGQGADDYSVRLPRDKAGLSGAASAIDLGRLGGSLDELYDFSRWLVAECQRGAPGTRDVREVIYSPDGSKVQRYSGVDGLIHDGPGNGDSSHTTHTHISYYRDSEQRDKVQAFAGYWEAEDVAITWHPITGQGAGTLTLKDKRGLVDLVTGKAFFPDDPQQTAYCRVSLEWPAGTVTRGYLVGELSHGCAAIDDAVASFTPTAPPGTGPAVLTGDDGSEYRRS